MDTLQSKVDIANYAISKFGGKRISSFTDGSETATVINAIYDQCRESLLEEHPWSFATVTVALNTLSTTPTNFGDGVSIAYALPPDFLKLYMVNIKSALIRFEYFDSQYCLLSDTGSLIIKYIFNQDDPVQYSSKFYEALACKLGKEACVKLTEANAFLAKLTAEYDKALASAMSEDSKLSTPDQPFQDQWETARLAGANTGINVTDGNTPSVGFGVTF